MKELDVSSKGRGIESSREATIEEGGPLFDGGHVYDVESFCRVTRKIHIAFKNSSRRMEVLWCLVEDEREVVVWIVFVLVVRQDPKIVASPKPFSAL